MHITNINDIVVDTNVFMHANNDKIKFCKSSKEFIGYLSNCNILLCLDDGFDPVQSKNQSHIAHEYFTHIRHGEFAYGILLKILSSKNYKIIKKSQYKKYKKLVNQCIRNTFDRIFICIAIVSDSKLFISNDFEDLDLQKRKYLEKSIKNLRILSSAQLC